MALEVEQFPGKTLNTQESTYTYYGGTAYLGLQTHPVFLGTWKRNLELYGTTYAASRHSNVMMASFKKGEQWLAGISGAEQALYVSSGFVACQLARKYFGGDGYKLFFAPHTHAALMVPGDKVHKDLEELRDDLLMWVSANPSIIPVLVFDTVDFTGDKPLQFEWLQSLPLDKLILVADDSHAIGITGAQGGGSYRTLAAMQPKGLVVCGSLGKGFAIGGGFILGEAKDLKKISQDPWYGGSSPGTPAGLEALMRSEVLLEQRRKQLQRNTQLFIKACKHLNRFSWSEGYPCFSTRDDQLAAYLKERAMVITSFHYPNADSPLMCRIVISAFHDENDILQLATALNNYYK